MAIKNGEMKEENQIFTGSVGYHKLWIHNILKLINLLLIVDANTGQ